MVGQAIRLLRTLVAFLVVGCVSVPTPKPNYTLAPPTPTLGASETAGPAAHARPYGAGDFATELADPGNPLPASLRVAWLAPLLAEAVWTYDGKPYRELTLTGSCDEGAPRCDLHVAGLPAFAGDRDAVDGYAFSVELAAKIITRAGRDALKGFPRDLVPELDALARSQDTLGQLDQLFLRNVVWMLPPPDDGYGLVYTTGTGEGGRDLLVLVDRATGSVMSIDPI